MATFEDVLHDYVRVRAQEYYKWKDYQYAIQYADSSYYINRVDDFIDEVRRTFHLTSNRSLNQNQNVICISFVLQGWHI